MLRRVGTRHPQEEVTIHSLKWISQVTVSWRAEEIHPSCQQPIEPLTLSIVPFKLVLTQGSNGETVSYIWVQTIVVRNKQQCRTGPTGRFPVSFP